MVSSAGFSPLGLYSVKMNLNKPNRVIDFFFPLPYFSVLLVIEKEKIHLTKEMNLLSFPIISIPFLTFW